MSGAVRVVGICLVRNEDRFLHAAIGNALALCDELIVADHASRDRTPEIARAWARRDGRVHYRVIANPSESHALLRPYFNTPTWVFGVDGDEVYDPIGLAAFRAELIGGRYARFRQIYGNVLHCVELDEGTGRARGYLAPPCRSMTKLYNFAALRDWTGPNPERLHGGTPLFNDGFDAAMDARLHEQIPWEQARFRCLHLVFLRRSSSDVDGHVRMNIAEQNNLAGLARLRHQVMRLFGHEADSTYKYEKYRRGPVVEVDARPFFPEGLP